MFEIVNTSNLYSNKRGMKSYEVEQIKREQFEEERNKQLKKYADECVICETMIKNEKDPLKKQKMINRLSLGVTDFSDLI